MATVRLTMAQALVRYLANQLTEVDGERMPLFGGVFAIFGHGNVAGLGEALAGAGNALPTLRGHNEQSMAHVAIAYAKTWDRRRMMACTTSIGPGATNLVTAAALAHVNRLPVLLLPGDTFATRAPDPVLQQIEDFGDPTVTANDCLRPVSRYWDRITRPEQLLRSLPAALATLLDPADCGPVTLALPQDVQAEAYDYPETFFAPRVHRPRRPAPDATELDAAVARLRVAARPLIVAGGGVHYAGARDTLDAFARRHGIPVAETQAGKGGLSAGHPLQVGGIGVTGSAAANALAAEADVVLAVGTRLADFPTASRSIFRGSGVCLIGLNVQPFDAVKHDGEPLVADARVGLEALGAGLGDYAAPAAWTDAAQRGWREWNAVIDRVTADDGRERPSDMQVLGAVNRFSDERGVVVCAAGGLPGELHKLWRVKAPGGYHLEYGYSCMGYEIAGGLGVKLAAPEREVFVLVGDGSYLMLNSELASSVALGAKLIVVLLDNRGYGCIHRLQTSCGGAPFNNLFEDTRHAGDGAPTVDFAAHARALGAESEKVTGIAGLEAALGRARAARRSYVVVIDTDPGPATAEGGAWWDVPVAETSAREAVREARRGYEAAKRDQRH
ncbi:3D-(3,5/4)-trihydroxycyclohexane-1,2-dione acylhydrolase (decyclizing) [Sediminicurvatus halobius]|uniref:3D-(3,5/4)-trihydroxycyclohexane-1,2-dione acylhydrolase (Decyclizing) n=1 Tax=Sediminicurvatus halobius TaxID=2182432 RepID=A0A2U2N784_9GAMM|nr:3D-(3,5/4)-trihydroxycyclohexane-1,2-dione acylhydrolase (decyclizing) [Spiribacter halobius]PWG64953.1 3D-(3,5/4)-trihydroxycyclohexane-1,2-dione acylhydrolase (decyclizing) [Spiribacter halobius]UEX78190.1 3D-(3,5/4)-trihydroxycyclohexane-1,2-dione acylhydrolase (decyclizing) [Spiribacter halobius]